MLKIVAPLLALLLFQDKPCDLKTIKDGLYCETCKKALKDDELADKEFCKICSAGKKPEERKKKCLKVKVCAKEYVPKCGMHDFIPHEKPC